MGAEIGAVVLAAGQGKRMDAGIAKQFMELKGKPLICHALEAFEKSPVDSIILVTGSESIDYCKNEIVRAYGFSKVTNVVPGGKERYDSVYEGLKAFRSGSVPDYVLIHDGARPLISGTVIKRVIEAVKQHPACVAGMPVKDTIKISNADGFASDTPERRHLWQIQTPQAFRFDLILNAYERMMRLQEEKERITDDAMVVETMTPCLVKLVEGDYRNIKVTTPEDLLIAEAFLSYGELPQHFWQDGKTVSKGRILKN